MVRNLVSAMIFTLVGAGWAPPAFAQAPRTRVVAQQAQGERVQLGVRVVRATPTGTVDPGLEPLARELKSKGLNGLDLVTHERAWLSDGGQLTVRLGQGQILVAKVLSHDAQAARVRVRVLDDGEQAMKTDFRVPRDKAILVKGPSTAAASIYVPISVSW